MIDASRFSRFCMTSGLPVNRGPTLVNLLVFHKPTSGQHWLEHNLDIVFRIARQLPGMDPWSENQPSETTCTLGSQGSPEIQACRRLASML